MSCYQLIKERERRLKRKLNAQEKAEIMEQHNHSVEEILDETGVVYAEM